MPNHQQHVIKQQIKWTVHFIGVRCVFSSITIHEILIPEVTMQKTILSKMNAINFGIFLKCITKIGRIMAGIIRFIKCSISFIIYVFRMLP